MSIIEHARKTKALIAATTHYAELKSYAVSSKGVANASCEFDVETLKPTYKLITGIPGKSNAFAISKRLGLPDEIIEDAKTRVNTENAAFEDALVGLEKTRLTLESERNEATKLLRDADADRRQAEELKTRLDKERGKAVSAAKREAATIIDNARKTAESVMNELDELRRKLISEADTTKLNDEKADLLRRLNEAENTLDETIEEIPATKPSREIIPGDKVRLRSLGTLADVVGVSSDGILSLQAGIMKITVRIDEVSLVEDESFNDVKKHIKKSEAKLREITVKPEIDLRGMNTDEALPIMEQFIDNARLAKLNTVIIIHGKGTGTLRRAVQDSLRRDKHGIKSFRLGVYGEGENGVTVVEL
jgi:DNA mismatch repair protein MutS2